MDKPRPLLRDEIETLKQAYAALNRNDIAGFTAAFDPQIERIEFADTPQAGTYHGLEAVKTHVSKARETWAEGSCQPERFIVAPPHPSGNRIIVITHVRVRLKHETGWREGRTADAFTFRNGQITLFRTFAEEKQALEWAGVKASGAD